MSVVEQRSRPGRAAQSSVIFRIAARSVLRSSARAPIAPSIACHEDTSTVATAPMPIEALTALLRMRSGSRLAAASAAAAAAAPAGTVAGVTEARGVAAVRAPVSDSNSVAWRLRSASSKSLSSTSPRLKPSW